MSDYLAFLVDECLTLGIAELAQYRGFRAMHATWVKLKSKDDSKVTSYAIDNDMILVTNNLIHFERRYEKRNFHPGIIFIYAEDRYMRKSNQMLMFEHALESAEENEPINEAISVTMYDDIDGNLVIGIDRYDLPRPVPIAKSREPLRRR